MTAAVKTSGKDVAALALHRFGFGAAGDQIAAIAGDPRGALLADLDRPNAGVLSVDLPTGAQAARDVFDFRAEEQAKQKLSQRAAKEAEASGMSANGMSANGMSSNNMPQNGMSPNATMAMADAAGTPPPKPPNQPPPLPQQILINEAKARFDAASSANIGFVERLVWFWSNHFCVSADKIPAMAGAYEREAIRPHVLGRFGDLLLAAESHPAMLYYLDNVESMGADSIAGINRDKGLNENLARETLELHTLGVRSGYSQEDVTSFAKVLTGWTWISPSEPERGGVFVFNKRLHQPGDQTVLGKNYPDMGVEQGRTVLADLARHPATAQHIARKLAQHFVADEPPPALVTKLANTFTASDGNLKQVAKTLVTSDEAWTPQRTKLKSPAEWFMGMLRLTGLEPVAPPQRVMNVQAVLGQPLWRPPAPNGYADTEAAWIDGVGRRLDIANELAGRLGTADPLALLDSGLGPLASADTRGTVARAESRRQAIALLVMAPEYLRR